MDETRKNSVLIADDEASNLIALTHILQPEYLIYAANGGAIAVESAKKFLPDIILLDIIMPEMDGYEVLTALKASEKTRNIPVIFVTGLSDHVSEEKGLSLGVSDYITKPFSSAIVKLRIKNQIRLIEQFRSNEYDIMKYKLSNDALNIALWDMDVVSKDPVNPTNTFTWSPEFRQMLGFTDENDFPNLLHSWSDRLHPEDKERTLNAFAAHLNDRTGQTPYNVENRIMVKNGEYRHFHALGTTFRDNAGVPLRTAGALIDITTKRQMETGMMEAMAKIEADAHWYKSVLDAIPLPISVIDANMNWTFVNKAIEDFLGKRSEDMYGKPCSNLNISICNTDDCSIACAKRGVKRSFFNHEDSSYQTDVEILKGMDGEFAGFIEILQDITTVQQLAKQQAESEMTSRAKSAFLANMSHEIRTPMNAILGITEIMMENESLPAKTKEGLGKIYSACNLLLGIINDILDFSKIEAGKLDIIPAEYRVASLINDSAQLNVMKIEGKPIDFKIKIDENIPAKLIGDELRIKQILNNLLSNAFKYTDTGTVILSVYSEPIIDEQHCDGGITLVLSVQDTGHGMTSDQVEKLFDEYSRFNQQSGRTIEGTGLGLSITRRLVSLMNGKITVESKPGTGTLFTVLLPQSTVDTEILGRELKENLQQFRMDDMKYNKRGQFTRDLMPYGKVLVVDDVEANLYVAEGLLKPYKLNVETVMSGYAAIDKIKDGNEYDIVFMDHMMPGIDGMETTKQLRKLGYTAPVVALTANAVAGQADLFMENGFDSFISKPIDIRQLNTVLSKLVRDKQPPEVLAAAQKQTADTPDSGAVTEKNPPGAKKENTGLFISGMDISKGLEKFDGDMEIYVKVLRSYTTSVRPMFDVLEHAGTESLIEYQRAVHSIKGTSLDIFAVPVGEKARELEEAARIKDLGFIEKENPAFIENVRKLISDIEDMLSAADAQNVKPKKDKIDRELLQKLHAFCETYDMDGVDGVMAEIERFQYEADGGLSAWLREHVNGVEFDGIAEKLAGYIK